MSPIQRLNKDLHDPIEQLEAYYQEMGCDSVRAWESMTSENAEFIFREIAKCLSSPTYYLQNYHIIRSKSAILQLLYPLWDSQEMFMDIVTSQFLEGRHIRLIVLKARQMGITTISVGLMCWLSFLHPMVHALSMSDEEARVAVNFEMARTAWENLPWWMRVEKRYDAHSALLGFDRGKQADRDRDPGFGSRLYFESANQPSGAAYSKSLYGAHLAEVARYRNSDAITEGIFGSLVRMKNSVGVMESTARGRTGKGAAWHEICEAAQEGNLGWEFLFIEWFREPGYVATVPSNFRITREEEALTEKVKNECDFDLTNEQIQWHREKKAEFEALGEGEKFDQEFPINPKSAFISSGACAFSKKRLNEMMLHFCRKPRWIGKISLGKDNKTPRIVPLGDGEFWIWEFPSKKATYYIGADPTLGTGEDPACAIIYAVPEDINKPLRQVARWRGYAAPIQFAKILAAIGHFYNTAEISVECNKVTTVASDLVKVLMYPKWYRYMRDDKIRNAYSSWLGWETNWKNKGGLISRFREALEEWTVIVRCNDDVDEMFDFVETEPGAGRYEGREHDDCVMAHMITYYCATQLRPRSDAILTEEPPPADRDFQNSDYSPIFDKDQEGDDAHPDFFML